MDALSKHWAQATSGCCLLQGMMLPVPQPFPAVISSHSPSCFVKALASSARPAPGPGAFGGFESQSAELYLRTNQKENSLLATGQQVVKNRLQTAFNHHYPASVPSPSLQDSWNKNVPVAGMSSCLQGTCFGNPFTRSSDH